MTEEDKELLVSLLKKAAVGGLLEIYDKDENIYGIDMIMIDKHWLNQKNKILIKIEEV
jgi:hypothetical protein